MGSFSLTINTDNDAFGDNPELEISRILEKLSEDIVDEPTEEFTLRDANGNKVGKVTWI